MLVVVNLSLGAIIALAGSTLLRWTRPPPIVIEAPPPSPTAAPTETPGPLRVYVSGEVGQPAVYELPPGSIVADVVEMAGSFTEEAAAEAVNLAQPLADGMHVHVPAEKEAGAPPIFSVSEPATAPGENGAMTVNINTATRAQLEALPGVGPATAEKIVAYREENGPFERIEEIMDVSGIGEAKFEGMKELITVE